MTARPKKTKIAEAFSGMWRITETELWDNDALDMVQPAFIRFDSARAGSMLRGWIFIYLGDDSEFVAERQDEARAAARSGTSGSRQRRR